MFFANYLKVIFWQCSSIHFSYIYFLSMSLRIKFHRNGQDDRAPVISDGLMTHHKTDKAIFSVLGKIPR